MTMNTFVVLAASYNTLGAAEADYRAVGDIYRESGMIETYDAAVITRDDTGKVRITAKHEQPTWRGLGIGLAGGALVPIYPAIGLGTGPLLGGAGGAGLGAMAGQVAAGLARTDLKDLGELLDGGNSGLLVVTVSDLADRVERLLVRDASGLTRKQLTVDEALVEKDIDAVTPNRGHDPDEAYQEAEAAVQEAEAEAAEAERAAQRYSTYRPTTDDGDLVSRLDDLARLRESGALSAAEFETAKARLLSASGG